MLRFENLKKTVCDFTGPWASNKMCLDIDMGEECSSQILWYLALTGKMSFVSKRALSCSVFPKHIERFK